MPEQGGSILRRATPLMLARLGVAAPALTVRNDRATSPLRRKAPEVAKARETGH